MNDITSTASSGAPTGPSKPRVAPDFIVKSHAVVNQEDLLVGIIRYEDDRIAIVQPTYSPTRIGFRFRIAGDRRRYAADNPIVKVPLTLREELHAIVVAQEVGRLKSAEEPAHLEVTVDPKQLECDEWLAEHLLFALHQQFYPSASWRELRRLQNLVRRMVNGT